MHHDSNPFFIFNLNAYKITNYRVNILNDVYENLSWKAINLSINDFNNQTNHYVTVHLGYNRESG